ncbi:MAG: SCO family protein [Dehalococcoidia bacterium]|nr:SCO family protein [Dehalococcoidia bacterium]
MAAISDAGHQRRSPPVPLLTAVPGASVCPDHCGQRCSSVAKVMRLVSQRLRWWPILALASGLMFSSGCAAKASFIGTELTPAQVAAPFTLRDQFGQDLELSSLKGKVVVMAFLYTNCPDICPLTTRTLGKAYDALGEDVRETAFVAITVDPERDTVEQVYRYSEQMAMLHKWAFLTGSRQEMEPVWRDYYVAAEKESSHDASAQGAATGYLVGHSAPVYLIDRDGKLRVAFASLPLVPQPLVNDIRLLLNEGG